MDKEEERLLVLKQAIELATKLDRPVYIIRCTDPPFAQGAWTPTWAIRLDNNMWFDRLEVHPNGAVNGCEQYC